MALFDEHHLNILFPQWQGSGYSNILFHGAKKIEQYFSEIHFQKIDVPEIQDLVVSNQILGYDAILSQLEQAKNVIQQKKPETIFIVGGDCGVELAPISYLNQLYKKNMGLIWFDAHGDLNTPTSSPSKHFHGMPLRFLCGDGDPHILEACFSIIQPQQVILAGAREFDKPEQVYIQQMSMTKISVDSLENNPNCLADEIKKKGWDNVYLHIDLDVLDPVAYKNVKHPTHGGLLVNTLFQSILTIKAECNVTGIGIVEFVPHHDTGLTEIKTLLDIFK
ncbi:MAG: arginase family protein [Proteobacteria bacterium]|nr:arginase family protein [Pseudomonadota bacterium]MBU1585811.1 arginase family protein [Pseudomonadota bacterium]MBU2451990.1 arginase family protein [Pseudomonadota bacterium]MBU2627224.1 arginase family protein [Pseudomonadota bacterium]